jgi:hypothetical protein
MQRSLIEVILMLFIFSGVLAGTSSAVTFDLVAGPATKTMPDGKVIAMWGFGLVGGAITVPGPVLTVPVGDTNLTINLTNNLPEAVSILIPGLAYTGTPARNPDGRARSLTVETAPGATGVYTWTWPNNRPGTLLYQSGSHPAVQVQMGLYGVAKKDFATGQAYNSASATYASEIIMVVSEIDPAVHEAVATNNFGPGKAMTSTIDYQPKYFLVNGDPFPGGTSPIPAGTTNQSTLIRFLNAGIITHNMVAQGLNMNLLAEDGYLYPFPKQQYSAVLPAGKTMDAMITTPATAAYFPIYDRRLNLTNKGAASPGGMVGYLEVAAATQFNLTVTRAGIGGIVGAGTVDATSLPGGINCGTVGTVCAKAYNQNTEIKLTATAKNGSRFVSWGGACSGTQADCFVSPLTANAAVTAIFSPTLIGVFRGGQWFLDSNGTGAWNGCGPDGCLVPFGMAGDLPVIGDWTGTGTTKIGVFRNGQWYLDLNGNGAWNDCGTDACYASFGMTGDIPISGDWNGTGRTKIGVFRNGQWFLDLDGNGVWGGCGADACYTFGQAGDIPVVGDWNGSGTLKIGVYRNGQWYLDLNGNGAWDGCGTDACYASFGQAGDIPVTGDWTGAGTMKIGLFRNGQWYLDLNGNGAWDGCGTDGCYAAFGMAGDKPVAGAW